MGNTLEAAEFVTQKLTTSDYHPDHIRFETNIVDGNLQVAISGLKVDDHFREVMMQTKKLTRGPDAFIDPIPPGLISARHTVVKARNQLCPESKQALHHVENILDGLLDKTQWPLRVKGTCPENSGVMQIEVSDHPDIQGEVTATITVKSNNLRDMRRPVEQPKLAPKPKRVLTARE